MEVAVADDATAAFGAGGLVFTKETSIRMKAEDLYISPVRVRVRFDFVNDSDHDIETIVAFPLPDINNDRYFETMIYPEKVDPLNFVAFETRVDGDPVPMHAEQRAYTKGKDITDIVLAAGLPINVIIDQAESEKKLRLLPEGVRRKLIAAGAIAPWRGSVRPLWTTTTKFYWMQRFPAKREVVINHSYRPVTGRFGARGSQLTNLARNPYVREFCMSEAAGRQAAKLGPEIMAPSQRGIYASVTDYILMTATNWKGSIGRFHMTLDRREPGNVLSLCWDGALEPTGPTTAEFNGENFTPTRDVHMLVLGP
jgi:hypothetical protein